MSTEGTMAKKVPVLIYSRVCGYFQPVSQWNNGKRAEFKDRYDALNHKFIYQGKNDDTKAIQRSI